MPKFGRRPNNSDKLPDESLSLTYSVLYKRRCQNVRNVKGVWCRTAERVLFVSLSVVKGWPPRVRRPPVPTRSSWSGLGRSGRSAPRRCGPCPPVNRVSYKPDVQSAVFIL